MHESQAVFFHRHHSQMGENPELRVLFYRLSNLLKMSVIPVFVFDGPNRPSIKRGNKIPALPHWMTERFKELIDAFGFHSHVVSAFLLKILLIIFVGTGTWRSGSRTRESEPFGTNRCGTHAG